MAEGGPGSTEDISPIPIIYPKDVGERIAGLLKTGDPDRIEGNLMPTCLMSSMSRGRTQIVDQPGLNI